MCHVQQTHNVYPRLVVDLVNRSLATTKDVQKVNFVGCAVCQQYHIEMYYRTRLLSRELCQPARQGHKQLLHVILHLETGPYTKQK